MDILALPLSTLLPLGGVVFFLAVCLVQSVLGKRKYPLPPGPPGEFILGHYRKIPFVAAFKQYAQWGKEYSTARQNNVKLTLTGFLESDVLYFETFGTKWIVLNSLKSAVDLLDKRGSNYSDRPRFILFEE